MTMAVPHGCSPAHVSWDLWGTYAFLAVAEPRLLLQARLLAGDVLAEVERACSRFREDSSLSAVNRHPGRWVEVDALLVAAVEVALAAADATEGLVDPCLGRAIVSLGYDRDLAALSERPLDFVPEPEAPRFGAWRDVRVTEDAVRIPEGVALDLGATAKAWAADLVAESVVEALGCAVVVSLGGDLRVHGPRDDAPASWPVVVSERPHESDCGTTVQVTGGLATSTTLVRRWATAAGPQHHVLDPRSGVPVPGAIRTATAAGSTCVAANTATTAALVLGDEAPSWLAGHGVAARLVASDGVISTVGDWPSTPQEAQ